MRASNRAGHVATMRSMTGSYCHCTRSATALPATLRSAATISSYDGWIANLNNPNWKGSDRYFAPAAGYVVDTNPATPAIDQPQERTGNATRHNPKARQPWNLNENFSLAKSFRITESVRVDLRGEAFNLFNRTIFGTGGSNLNSNDFGVVTNQVNNPRQMQVALKIYW